VSLPPGHAEAPHWWEAAPRPVLPEQPVPARSDAVIVGSGITGLNAALVLARAGRQVTVFEAGEAGAGASTRNAGYVGRSLKHDYSALLRRHGRAMAAAVYAEMQAANDAVFEVVQAEAIACHLERCGRVVLAHSPRQMRDLAAELALKQEHLGEAHTLLDRAGVAAETGSDRFAGGALIPDLAALHPGLYHAGLLERALAAGVTVLARTPVTGVGGGRGALRVASTRGATLAREVLFATNGYTGAGAPGWLRRRVIPFDAWMFATEALSPNQVAAILPANRTFIDANHDILFARRSPDGRRILFGGQTGVRPRPVRERAAALHALAASVLPGMAGLRVDQAWTGRCAGTLDLYPHLAERDGVWFAGGYCFAGVPMGTYLGRKAAWQMLGRAEGATHFATRPFPGQPLPEVARRLVPAVMAYWRACDRRAMRAR
jgi:glycine/D-amino acid oxidase-like deaminating enzyme